MALSVNFEKMQKQAVKRWREKKSRLGLGYPTIHNFYLFIEPCPRRNELILETLREIDDSFRDSFEKILRTMSTSIENISNVNKKAFKNSERVELSRMEIASILANAFFCNFPPDNKVQLNFSRLFDDSNPARDRKSNKEKIKCLLKYLTVVFHSDFNGKFDKVIYEKKKCENINILQKLKGSMWDVKLCEGNNFGLKYPTAQVAFSNRKLGGGVLGNGCLQEEIMFVSCPELIVAKLVCPEMQDTEAIIVGGVLQYADFTGYADTFQFSDKASGRRLPIPLGPVICMDAIDYSFPRNPSEQYKLENVQRELVKALAGFSAIRPPTCDSIASGYWGCGNFKGDPVLKTLIQWIAASASDSNLQIYSSSPKNRDKEVENFINPLRRKSTMEVYKATRKYCEDKLKISKGAKY